jgi:prolipoprotein diacylglyceryltransferase
LAISIPIAAAFVRVGNLMNHEIVGKITTAPWAFNFTMGSSGVAGTLRHPAQIYEAAVYLLLFIALVIYYFKFSKSNVPPGLTVGILLVVIFTARFIIEFFKEVQVAKEHGMMLDIGQILSIPFVIIGVGCIVYAIKNRNKSPHFIESQIATKTEKNNQ